MEKERAEESSLEIRNKVKNDCQCHTSLNLYLNDHVSPFAHCPGLSSYLHQGQGEGQVSGEGCRLPLGTRYIIRRKPLTRYKIREKPSTRYTKVHNACKGYRHAYICVKPSTPTQLSPKPLYTIGVTIMIKISRGLSKLAGDGKHLQGGDENWQGDHHDQNQQGRRRELQGEGLRRLKRRLGEHFVEDRWPSDDLERTSGDFWVIK